MNETCAVCGKPFEWGQRITCADGEPRHGGCNPGQIERERQDLLGADPERQALADAWGAWVREGRIRGWTQDKAEIVYRAFCAAWAAGRHDLDTEVTAVVCPDCLCTRDTYCDDDQCECHGPQITGNGDDDD